jgi:hypothetical protein
MSRQISKLFILRYATHKRKLCGGATMKVELVVPFERASREMRQRAVLSLSLPDAACGLSVVRDAENRIAEILVPFNQAESWMLWKCERIVKDHRGNIIERIGATPEAWEDAKRSLSCARQRLFSRWSDNGITWCPADEVATFIIGRGGSHPVRTVQR